MPSGTILEDMVTCYTSVTISVDVRSALGRLKIHPRQSFNEVIASLLVVHGSAVEAASATPLSGVASNGP